MGGAGNEGAGSRLGEKKRGGQWKKENSVRAKQAREVVRKSVKGGLDWR